MSDTAKPLDLLIVGAGISGISAACYLTERCPEKKYAIIEARDDIGGTWDLFRYPGIRSDSDMHTFGFEFKPWTDPKALADGPSIKAYLNDAIDEFGVRNNIQFGARVISANWGDEDSLWLVTVQDREGSEKQLLTRVLFMCSGYYNYDHGYTPEFPGAEAFKGELVHPQHWPEDLDYTGKKVAVIGSGATAVTLVPAMTEKAEQVTMIQRSPTYVVSRPGEDRLAKFLNKILPDKVAYWLVRWRNIRFQDLVYKRSRTKPQKMREQILHLTRKELGEDYPIERDFTPRYNPWDQRLCLVPDADLFKAIRSGKARVVTAEIDRFTESGVLTKSGELVEADIVVTATGLELQLFGGVKFYQDGRDIEFPNHFTYQGMMVSDVPNLVWTFGYINASWTLRADLNSQFVCDMFQHMDATGTTRFVPRLKAEEQNMPETSWIEDFNPGYIQRGVHQFPKQGEHQPWRNTQDYLLDRKLLKKGLANDGVLQFQ
ncbi:MAG: NAD(P)/FAD-dependent oxidoreductase [Gammaproteobacteria bacterium]|nr:NAD(P)/FAD-dependent oxidoreductase [Gammaproteobacteria bacterium]